ncbi:MAG TPA: hypothetical protein VF190_11435 [Rhodothermales bacterium]
MDEDIWDEHRWEAFLRENDRRVDRYMSDLYQFLEKNPQPDPRNEDEMLLWKAQLRSFMEARGWADPELPLQDDADSEMEDPPLDLEDLVSASSFFTDPEDDVDGVHRIPVYNRAVALGTSVLAWANMIPGDVKDSTLVQFCSHIMQIAANLAKGHGIGYEQDMIGGNIACVKRGLGAANTALSLLHEMQHAPYIDDTMYVRLYEDTFEVRNEVGLYVQELRRRFELGID